MRKRIGILTGGGDVPPLNAVIGAAKRAAEEAKIDIVGFLHGWNGVLESDFVDLEKVHIDPRVGGTILKSSRVNIARAEDGISRALSNLERAAPDGLIVIGGEDTLSNVFHLKSYPQIMISKTIDNDVGRIDREGDIGPASFFNYFTLGFPTAADKIAAFVSWPEGLRTTAYSHERIMIVESMGMHAGWLALASGMGRPDLIVIPEFPVAYDSLLEKIIARYNDQRHVIVVVAEGAKWDDGSYIQAEKDDLPDFDHPRFGGAAAAVAKRLKAGLQGRVDTRNINAVNPSYLYRSGAPNSVDRKAAGILGEKAVRLLAGKIDGPVFLHLRKKARGLSADPTALSEFWSIEDLHRFVDRRFYDPETLSMTEAASAYLGDLVRDLPLPGDYGIRTKGGDRRGIRQ